MANSELSELKLLKKEKFKIKKKITGKKFEHLQLDWKTRNKKPDNITLTMHCGKMMILKDDKIIEYDTINNLLKKFDSNDKIAEFLKIAEEHLQQIENKIDSLLTQANNDNDNDNKRIISSQSLISGLLIAGYIRTESGNNDILSFALDIIYEYIKKLNTKYMDILIGKEQHFNLGNKSLIPNLSHLQFDRNSDWFFDTEQCVNCGNINCLKFIANYKNEGSETNIWYNNLNEYQCDICKYFIGANIKRKYIEYRSYNNEYNEKCYTLIIPAQRKDFTGSEKKEIEQNKKFKCIECDEEMENIQRTKELYYYQTYTKIFIDYCDNCQLIRRYQEDNC